MKQQRYIPETRITEAKSTQGTEFVIKGTKDFYRGPYIETYEGRYYAGKSIENSGDELEKVATRGVEDTLITGVTINGYGLITQLLKKLYKKTLTKGELTRGVARRFFLQDKKTNKINEVDYETYQLAQKELPNRRFAEIDWNINGPAEDLEINGYKYEGAESKNKKTIQNLEKTMPGISKYVVDFSEFVQKPADKNLNSYEEVITNSEDTLDNFKKANFDLRK